MKILLMALVVAGMVGTVITTQAQENGAAWLSQTTEAGATARVPELGRTEDVELKTDDLHYQCIMQCYQKNQNLVPRPPYPPYGSCVCMPGQDG